MAVAYVAAVTNSVTSVNFNASGNATTTVTVAVTPAVGEVLILKVGTGDSKVTATSVTDSVGTTWTGRAGAVQANFCAAYVYSATAISATATTITVTLTNSSTTSGAYPVGLCVERYTGAMVDGTCANDFAFIAATGTDTVPTTYSGSIWTWVDGDWNAVTTGTPTYTGTSTPVATGTPFRNASANFFYANQTATTAGTQTYGMTAPTGQKMSLAGVEVAVAGSTLPVSASRRTVRTARQAVARSYNY